MPFELRFRSERDYVVAAIEGVPEFTEFLDAIREIGRSSVSWPQRSVIVDLRPVARDYSFTEQLQIGQAVAVNLGHLRKAAAVVQQHRITRVGERAARHSGAAHVGVFATEEEAVAWIRAQDDD